MQEVKGQPYGVQTTTVVPGKADMTGKYIIETPVWVTVVRGFQLFFAFIILILSGILIHGLALDPICFALVCGLFTFIVSLYSVLTEKIPSWHQAYNHWAVLALDILMVIFWLSSMASVAALRASFTVAVDADCWDDGSAVNAGHCTVYRRGLNKRYAVLTKTGQAEMAAIAGLSALVMLLFVASLGYIGHYIRMHNNSLKSPSDPAHVEMNAQQQPMLNEQAHVPAGQGPVYSDNYQYQPTSTVHSPSPYPSQQQPIQPQYTGPQQAPYDEHKYPHQPSEVPAPSYDYQHQTPPPAGTYPHQGQGY